MTGMKLLRAVEGVMRGRNLPWLVFVPQFQPEQADGWWTLTAWHETGRTSLRLHKSMLEDEAKLVNAVMAQLPPISKKATTRR